MWCCSDSAPSLHSIFIRMGLGQRWIVSSYGGKATKTSNYVWHWGFNDSIKSILPTTVPPSHPSTLSTNLLHSSGLFPSPPICALYCFRCRLKLFTCTSDLLSNLHVAFRLRQLAPDDGALTCWSIYFLVCSFLTTVNFF